MNILQFELWLDCPNSCKFCAIREFKTFKLDKIQLLKKAILELDKIDWNNFDELDIIGGELLTEDLTKEHWYYFKIFFEKVIGLLKTNQIQKFYIVSSLLNRCFILKNTLDLFEEYKMLNKLSINTSWDYKDRFNDRNLIIWKDNIQEVLKRGCEIHYETILTEALIKGILNDEKEAINMISHYNIDLIRPSGSYSHSNEHLEDFFIVRKDFFKFLDKLKILNNRLYENLFNLNKRACEIHTLPTDEVTNRLNNDYIEEVKDELNDCGHDKLYTECYKDSKSCIICDILKYKELDNDNE